MSVGHDSRERRPSSTALLRPPGCDGSDEPSRSCANTCSGGSAEVAAYRAGAAARAAYVAISAVRPDKGDDDTDYGDGEAYWPLSTGSCVELKSGVFSYELCLFRNASQSAPGNERFSLGGHVGWGDGGPASRELRFEGGDKCGDKPRSATALLRCGAVDSIMHESEPEMCSYQFEVGVRRERTCVSPMACCAREEKQAQRRIHTAHDSYLQVTTPAACDAVHAASISHLIAMEEAATADLSATAATHGGWLQSFDDGGKKFFHHIDSGKIARSEPAEWRGEKKEPRMEL